MTLLHRYYNLNGYHLFLFIILGNLTLIWLSKFALINETVFYNAFSEQLSYDRAMQLFKGFQSISWVSYILNPLVLSVKFSLVSFILYVGIVFNNMQYRIALSSVFKIVIASDIVFLLAGAVKFLWFYFFAGNYNLNDIGFFYPLSLTNIFRVTEVDRIWVYPMQSFNLFHLAYVVLLSYGLSNVCKLARADSEKIVLLSYLPSLILWLSLIMFLTIDGLS